MSLDSKLIDYDKIVKMNFDDSWGMVVNKMQQKGLTEIREHGRGFVGRRGLKYDHTNDGRSRLRFDIASGVNDINNGKYTTWRHCVCYGALADAMKNISPGRLVYVEGWLSSEVMRDEYHKPIIINNEPKIWETLILEKAEYRDKDKENAIRQLALGSIASST